MYEIGIAERNVNRLYTAINILEDAYVEAHDVLKSKNSSQLQKAKRLICYILLSLGMLRIFDVVCVLVSFVRVWCWRWCLC